MRIRKHWILAVGLAYSISHVSLDEWRCFISRILPSSNATPMIDNTRTTITYTVDSTGWTSFDLPPNCSMLRILTNANLRAEELNAIATGKTINEWDYALKYRFIDEAGEDIALGDYHFRSRIPAYRDPTSRLPFAGANYDDNRYVPASMRQMLYSLRPLPRRGVQLKLRLIRVNPSVADVGVRVYCQFDHTKKRLDQYWLRLSQTTKERLARTSVYGPQLLSDVEKRNLLASKWTPLAPSGVVGDNYHQRTMHTRKVVNGEEIRDGNKPAGLLIEPNRRGTIPLPEKPGQVRLHFMSACLTETATSQALLVHYYRRHPFRHECHRVEIANAPESFEQHVDGGLLEIESSQELIVRAFWRADVDSEETEVTADQLELSNYIVDDATAVEFSITHVSHQPTPFRFTLRSLHSLIEQTVDEVAVQPRVQAEWQMIDRNDAVIDSGEITADFVPSLYDRLAGKETQFTVSEPVNYFSALPEQVVRFRIRSLGSPILLAAFTRPQDLVKVTRVPEDYSSFHRTENHHRTWYRIRAANHELFANQECIKLISLQPRPPQLDAGLLAGQYKWEEFHPNEEWIGRFALIPRDSSLPFRPRAAVATFCELADGQGDRIQFVCPPGNTYCTPRIIYLTSEVPATFKVYLNERLKMVSRITASTGQLELPAITDLQNRYSIRIETQSQCRLFLNCIQPDGRPAFYRRLLSRIENEPQSYEYVKESDDETLMIRFFGTGKNDQRLRMKLTVNGPSLPQPRPHERFTMMERIFDLRMDNAESALILGNRNERIGRGQIFFLPLGSDLPRGKYCIQLKALDECSGYVMVSKTTAGVFEERMIRIELRKPLEGQ